MEFEKRWMGIFRDAKNEYREKATRYRDCECLRQCYLGLALKNRASQRECKLKMSQVA
ncbi:hypothetical protein ACQV2B_02805 [Pantoea allii]|uniref:hypothetical protein n=1 Tax=Pantoea allii TaxID=574096 RepID=UPI003D3100E7